MSCGCNSEILAQSEILTPCECPAAGFCERHKCTKTERFHELCKTRPDYFMAWENGIGPCISVEPSKPGVIGLGTIVAAAIQILTFGKIRPSSGCGCEKRKAWLNRFTVWGWWKR